MKSSCYKNSLSRANEFNIMAETIKRLQNIEQEKFNIDEAFKLNLKAIEILNGEFHEAKKIIETVYNHLSDSSLDNIVFKRSPNQNPAYLQKSIAESTTVSFKDDIPQKVIELAKKVTYDFNDLIKQIEYLKQENFNFKKTFDSVGKNNAESESKLRKLIENLAKTEKKLKNEESEKKIALSKVESVKIELNEVKEELLFKISELNKQIKANENDYKNKINDLEKRNAKAEREKLDMNKKIFELDKKSQEYEQNLRNFEKEKEEIKKSFFNKISTLDEENAKYKKLINDYESRYQEGFNNPDGKKINEEKIAMLYKEIEENKAKIIVTQVNNVAMVNKIKEINEKCENLKSTIIDLERRLYQKDTEINSLKASISIYKNEDNAQKEIKILKDEKDLLLNELSNLSKEKDKIEKKLNSEYHLATSAEYYRKIIMELEKKNNYY
ncbi:hypothetical protein SteCoe_15006 [Stentor coeruleus]|uniref:Uncharacterized protein n=1 Tax=Stentor coeruleus TaxID=5963 RepID=A0A1R2C4L1_9CILI|nr:hypothetical protein SteCoe_15006 [Stentor coeruleus]